MSIPTLGLATAAALIATTSFSCWLQSLKWFFLIHFGKWSISIQYHYKYTHVTVLHAQQLQSTPKLCFDRQLNVFKQVICSTSLTLEHRLRSCSQTSYIFKTKTVPQAPQLLPLMRRENDLQKNTCPLGSTFHPPHIARIHNHRDSGPLYRFPLFQIHWLPHPYQCRCNPHSILHIAHLKRKEASYIIFEMNSRKKVISSNYGHYPKSCNA